MTRGRKAPPVMCGADTGCAASDGRASCCVPVRKGMVEAAGIEPASASPTRRALHAYPRLCISPQATRRAGKTCSQSVNDFAPRSRTNSGA